MKKKILILSYFYPPCSLTASQRALGYVTYLIKNNFYPVVVTKHWDNITANEADISGYSDKPYALQQFDTHEIHYTEYKTNLRDALLKYSNPLFVIIRKVLSLFELVFQNFSIDILSYAPMYHRAKKLIRDNPDIKDVLIIASPYQLFHFGHQLKKDFPQINWYADYRDDWNTKELIQPRNALERWIKQLEIQSEKKWLSNVTFAISVSEVLCRRISAFIQKPCHFVENGYFEEEFQHLDNRPDPDKYVICYTGQIYDNQPYKEFIETLNRVIDHIGSKIQIQCIFLGAAFNQKHKKIIEGLTAQYASHYVLTERVPKSEVLKTEAKSNLLLMMAYGDLKGIPSSKLYQYLGHRKPILLFPSDRDVIENIITSAGCGIIANDQQKLFDALTREIENCINGKKSSIFAGQQNSLDHYSREFQIKKFIALLK